MKHYIIIETNVTDPSWIPDYLDQVTPMVESYGGIYLTRTAKVELLEGDGKAQFSLLAEFPTREAAVSFYHSDDYRPYKEARQAGSTSRMLLVPAECV